MSEALGSIPSTERKKKPRKTIFLILLGEKTPVSGIDDEKVFIS
jgi:hypothetical protein